MKVSSRPSLTAAPARPAGAPAAPPPSSSPGESVELSAAARPRQPLTPLMKKALDRAQRRFGHIPGAEISVSASPASGGRPVILVRHKDADPNNLTVQTHFHGWQMYDKSEKYDERIGDTVAAAWQKDKNRVFVLPESVDEGTGQHVDWSNIRNLNDITRTAVENSGSSWNGVTKFVISGHSAGGAPISAALNRAMDGKDGPFDRVELYDAVMNSPDEKKTRAYIRNHSDEMLYVPGVMNTPWMEKDGIPRNRQTHRYKNHFQALWESLGQLREPEPPR